MKKLFVLSVVMMGCVITLSAQTISPNAIGLRLGDSNGFGAEISYQRALGDDTRLEVDLGWRDGNDYNGLKLAGLHQWVWNLDGNFNWYAGAGGGFGIFNYDNVPNNQDDTDSFLFIAGDIGVEYDFDIPLLISLDFRPEIGFGDDRYDNDDLDFDIALSFRYQF